MRLRDVLRVEPGAPVVLRDEDARTTPGWDGGGKAEGRAALAALGPRLLDLQERLWAQGTVGDRRRVVLLLQGTDASGKDGVTKKALGQLSPRGLDVRSFGRPTPEELAEPFLARFARALPPGGSIAAWNRTAYEDVLVVRVHGLVPAEEWQGRYELINTWEQRLVEEGTVLLKVLLQISAQEQAERLAARLDRPDKHWKVDPSDYEDRVRWEDYRAAYTAVLERCSTEHAPWYRVPADRKWYRDWAVATLLLETLEDLDLDWPARPDLDLAALRACLARPV